MEGKIGFAESLRRRMAILSGKITLQMIEQVGNELRSHISPFFVTHRDYFRQRSQDIYILSGGFEEIIWPVAQLFDIAPDHVFANQFSYQDNLVNGYEADRYLAQDNGKVLQAAKLGFSADEVIVIGDGSTDRKIKETGLAQYFFAFTANVLRAGTLNDQNGKQVADGTHKALGVFIEEYKKSGFVKFLSHLSCASFSLKTG